MRQVCALGRGRIGLGIEVYKHIKLISQHVLHRQFGPVGGAEVGPLDLRERYNNLSCIELRFLLG